MTHHTVEHCTTAKNILRYVKGTIDFAILYGESDALKLTGYIDSDWAGSVLIELVTCLVLEQLMFHGISRNSMLFQFLLLRYNIGQRQKKHVKWGDLKFDA